jgi:hypothetical protein
MASYKSTIELSCWKQHRCAGCGAAYRYLFKRSVTGTGSSGEAAAENARNRAAKVLADAVDPWPCPRCGLYQPDMVVQRRAGQHGTLLVVTAIALVLALILGGSRALTMPAVAWSAALVGGLLAAGHALAALRDPNRDPERNGERARAAVEQGKVALDEAGGESATGPGAGAEGAPVVSLALLLAGVLCLPLAELARVAGGWPLNPELYPPVVGPGDTTRVYLPDSITSIKGYWNGSARVAVENPADLGPGAGSFSAASKQGSWGSSISAKSSEKSSKSRLWADVTVPPEPALAGKTARLRVDVDASYPQLVAGRTFHENRSSSSTTTQVVLAPPGAGAQYQSLWWGGLLGGGALLLLAGFLLRRRKPEGTLSTQVQLIPVEGGPGGA